MILEETSGLAIKNQDSLYNGGQLVIDSVSNYGYGIENTGTLLNDGTITISDLEAQAIYNLSGGLIVNQDSVVIRDCTHAINNVSDSITNSSSGVIQIKDVDTAITGETPSTYINHGQIQIENAGSGISVSGHFFQWRWSRHLGYRDQWHHTQCIRWRILSGRVCQSRHAIYKSLDLLYPLGGTFPCVIHLPMPFPVNKHIKRWHHHYPHLPKDRLGEDGIDYSW